MASITFRKYDTYVEHDYFINVQAEVLHMFDEFESILKDYKGTFEITIDKFLSNINYTPVPGETLDAGKHQSNLSFLNEQLRQIANSL